MQISVRYVAVAYYLHDLRSELASHIFDQFVIVERGERHVVLQVRT